MDGEETTLMSLVQTLLSGNGAYLMATIIALLLGGYVLLCLRVLLSK